MDLGYIGSVDLEGTLPLSLICRNGSLVASTPDSAPAYTIYPQDSNTAVTSGNLSGSDTGSKTGFRTGEVDCTAANGFASGSLYRVLIEYAVSSTSYKVLAWFHVR